MNDPSPPSAGFVYTLEDRPPLPQAAVLALQHVLTMFGATVSVPLLLGPAMGMSLSQTSLLISSVMLASGLATLLQSTFGTRLPIIQGISFSFLAAFFAIIAAGQREGWTPPVMMQYIAGAIVAGAAGEMLVGFTGVVGRLRRAISPVAIGPVIMLIGLALFKHGAPKAATHLPIGALTIALIILFALFLAPKFRFFRLFPILTAVVVVVTLCWILSAAGVFYGPGSSGSSPTPAHPSYVDLSAVGASPWLRLDPREIFFPWGWPKFSLAFTLAVLAAYLASIIESFGDYHACAAMAGAPDPTPRQISRGIGFEGIGCLLSGVLGGFSSTSYSENIGLVGITKVASRYVVQLAAVALILLGLFGKFGAFAAAIPGPVVGGVYCALFGLIAAVGVQQLARADLSSDRNLFIAGFSLFMGLSVPAFFDGSTAALYPPGPEPLLSALPGWLAGAVKAVGETSMAVAAICGIALDNLIPATVEERGLPPASASLPQTVGD